MNEEFVYLQFGYGVENSPKITVSAKLSRASQYDMIYYEKRWRRIHETATREYVWIGGVQVRVARDNQT